MEHHQPQTVGGTKTKGKNSKAQEKPPGQQSPDNVQPDRKD